MAGGRDPRVDELREQLRALGYLDARLDRFVLGGASRRRPPLALALTASARIGLLAGVLLGPAAAIGLRARLPGLVTSGTDAVVLAGYLALLFGVAAAVLAFISILVAGQIARRTTARPEFAARARRAAAAAGLVVSAACLLYLTLWWRSAITGSVSSGIGGTVTAVAVAAAISLILGHGVTVTVLAYLARTSGTDPISRRGLPLSSWTALLSLGLLAFAGAMALLFVSARRVPNTDDAPTLTVVSTGLRVDVIAIDGLDLATLDRLQSAGRLPALGRIRPRAVSLSPESDRDPAQVWTTIATGQPPERHGIRGLESHQIAGLEGQFRSESPAWSALTAATDLVRLTRPAIASGEQRLIPAFWEVAARAGLRTAVLHWWATWPAPDRLGVVLSDRAILRLEAGGPLDGEIAPASLYPALLSQWPERRARAAEEVAKATPTDAPPEVAAVYERAAALDATILDLASDPLLGPLDLRVIYLPGLDIVQHSLFGASEPGALASSAAAERLKAVEQYYVFLDRALGRLLDAATASDLTIVVAQPGRVAQTSPGVLAVLGRPAMGAATGAPALPGTAVAPTVLYALGVPIARDLAAPAATTLFDAAFVGAHPPRFVSTYGSRQVIPSRNSGRTLDREMIERMRTLGYIR